MVITDGVDNALPDVYGPGSRTTFAELLDRVGRSVRSFSYLSGHGRGGGKTNRVPRDAYTLARSHLAQLAVTSVRRCTVQAS